MIISVICNINLIMGENIFKRVLMMPGAVFSGSHLRSARIIALIDSGMGRFYGIGDAH